MYGCTLQHFRRVALPTPRQPLSRMCCTFAGVKLCGLGTSAELTPAIPRSTGGLGDRNQLPIIFQTLVS